LTRGSGTVGARSDRPGLGAVLTQNPKQDEQVRQPMTLRILSEGANVHSSGRLKPARH